MTDKEMIKTNAQRNGLEVTEIGCTLQWTMANGQTCIIWFNDDGSYTGKTEHRG